MNEKNIFVFNPITSGVSGVWEERREEEEGREEGREGGKGRGGEGEGLSQTRRFDIWDGRWVTNFWGGVVRSEGHLCP